MGINMIQIFIEKSQKLQLPVAVTFNILNEK